MATKNQQELPPLTPRQEKVKNLSLENLGKKGDTKTKGQILKEAGFAPAMQKNPKIVFDSPSLKAHLDPFIAEIDRKRRMALKGVTPKKISKQSAYTNALTVDVLTKNHQLLTGGATENVKNPELDKFRNEMKDLIQNVKHQSK